MTEKPREDAFAEASIFRQLLRIAMPLTLSSSVRYVVELSNAYWVGKLGVVALSIVTALGTFLSLSRMFAGITSGGTSAIVGRLMGEGRDPEAVRLAQKVTAVTPALGAIVAVLALAASPVALDTLRYEGPSRTEAMKYLVVLLCGLPASFGLMSMNGVLVGLGRPRASMIASTASLLAGFGVTPVMLKVFHTGVWGAGLAQVIGDAVGYVIGLAALTAQARQEGGHLSWARRFQKLRELWPVVRLGGPLTIDSVIHGTVWFGLVAFLARYGAEYVAAQGAEERLTQILNLPTEGVAPAAVTLVGYMMGRGRRKDALRVVWLSLGMVAAVALVGATLLRLTPTPVVAWLCNDPAFVHVGVKMLAIAAIGLAFVGGRDVMEASFGGIGDTIPPVIVGIGVALSRFPLAYLLAVKLGTGGLGVAWAVNGTLMAQTLVLIGWFLLRFRTMKGMEIETIPTSLPPGKITDEHAA